jgi:hypothetical protein
MKEQLAHLHDRTTILAEKLSALSTLANQVTDMLKVADEAEEEQQVLAVNIDEDGDFVCTLDGETITLLNPHDVVTLAGWLDATVQSATPQVEQELKDTGYERDL